MYDLIIVGGGPSGTAAGIIAGQLDLSTLLIEKQTFPRAKPCGGAISERAMSYLNFEIPDPLRERNVFGARVHFDNHIIEKHKSYRIAMIVTRSVLDDFLFQKAKATGIKNRMEQKVQTLIEKSDYVEVYTNQKVYKSKFVIVAEGSTGKLKYLVRRKDKKDEFGISVVTEIERENEIIDHYIYDAIDIHFGIANMGFGWIFPHEKYFSVGVGGVAIDFPTPQKIMREFLNDNGFKGNYELKTHMVPMGGIKRKLLTSRIVLCGDAAGFVDSFTGEGLAYAIRSGQIAVEVIYKIVSLKNALSSLVDYELLCDKEFGDNLKYSLMLSRLMHKYPKIFFKIFTGNDQPLDKFLEVSAVKTTYKDFIKWLILKIPILLWNT